MTRRAAHAASPKISNLCARATLAAIEGGERRLPMTEEDPKGATKEMAEAKKPTKEGCG